MIAKFKIYESNNGWILEIPKDKDQMNNALDMLDIVKEKMGIGDAALAKAKNQEKIKPVEGVFIFPSFKELTSWIEVTLNIE